MKSIFKALSASFKALSASMTRLTEVLYRGKPVIENPRVGDEVTLHGYSESGDGERGRIVSVNADAEEGICVELVDKIGFTTKQWCSCWELERVDVVTQLGEIE